MTLVDVVRFAAQALRGHRLRTGLSLLGVAIGVAAVVLLTGLGEGARRYVTGEFATLGTNLLIVIPGKTETSGMAPITGGVPRDLTLDDALALERFVPEIRRVAPVSVGEAPARVGEREREVTVIGTTSALVPVRQLTVRSGRYLPEGDPRRGGRVCVIGAGLQRELFEGRNPLGAVLRLGDRRFRVIGVIAPRGESLGMNLDEIVHVPVVEAMNLFDRTSLFRAMAEVRSHVEIDAASAAAIELMKQRHDGVEDITVVTQDSVLSTFGSILGALTAALGAIAAISITVAGVGIMNVMLVSVSERIAEIGLLKATGAAPGQILLVFLAEAVVLSGLGGLVGLAAGLGGAHVLRVVFPEFPAQPPAWAIVGGLVVALGVGVVFGALPARRASRLDPVVALMGGRR